MILRTNIVGLKEIDSRRFIITIHAQKFFGTIDDFFGPLEKYLSPTGSNTVEQQFDTLNGRIVGWLALSYGRKNIKKFIKAADAVGFDELVDILRDANIKTTGRFSKYLDDMLNEIL